MPAHCGLPGNERADALAKEAAGLSEATPVDVLTLWRAVARAARRKWRADWPAGWYRDVIADCAPVPVRANTREEALDIHLLRAGGTGFDRNNISTASDGDRLLGVTSVTT